MKHLLVFLECSCCQAASRHLCRPFTMVSGSCGAGEKKNIYIYISNVSLEKIERKKTELERNSFSMRAAANRLAPRSALRRCRGEDGSGVCSTFLSATLLTTYLFLVIEL